MKIRTIPELFKTEGMTLKLVERGENWAIYENQHRHYEFHRVRTITVRQTGFDKSLFIKGFTHKEVLAGSEEFGTHAWSCHTLADARQRINSYCAGL